MLIQIVVTVAVRGFAHQNHNFAVQAVQFLHHAPEFRQGIFQARQHHLQLKDVAPLAQIQPKGLPLRIRQGFHRKTVGIGKTHHVAFRKRHVPVNAQPSQNVEAITDILPVYEIQDVIPVLRDVDLATTPIGPSAPIGPIRPAGCTGSRSDR